MLGLVLTAGGARGAYQVGVLKRIAELRGFDESPLPFAIVTGASAGAINGALLAARGPTFRDAASVLAHIWSELEVHHVYRTDVMSFATSTLGLLRDLLLGGVLGHTVTQAVFDARPLHRMIARHLPSHGIADGIRRGHLYAVAITATSYHSGRSFTFVQGRAGHRVWQKRRRVVLPVEITADHVAASAAIPLLFTPVQVPGAGEGFFGDGGLRLVTPFSPAIRLGATHLLAVGVRSQRAADALAREELGSPTDWAVQRPSLSCPPLAQVCGVFLNAIFLDHLDSDLDHLQRMNDLIRAYQSSRPADVAPDVTEPMRLVTPLVLSPSEDLAMVAQRFAHRLPRLVRFLLEGLGTPDAQSADLTSYLLFDAGYARVLMDIGYRDANERIDEIEAFLHAGHGQQARALGALDAA